MRLFFLCLIACNTAVCGDAGQRGPWTSTGPRRGSRLARIFEGSLFALIFSVRHGARGIVASLEGSQRIPPSEKEYFRMLEAVRLGKKDRGILDYFNRCRKCDRVYSLGVACCGEEEEEVVQGGVGATADPSPNNPPPLKRRRAGLMHIRLCTTRSCCDETNRARLDELRTPVVVLPAVDVLDEVEAAAEGLGQGMLRDELNQAAPRHLYLKVGARVLLTRALAKVLPSGADALPGSLGTVLNLSTSIGDVWADVLFDCSPDATIRVRHAMSSLASVAQTTSESM